ncbi:MAG: DUF1501 domain-containing protein [Planctomycetes bacterium]|nr:DUF1501 domain-containing protein [Planctomycetota bacterium]
MSDQGISRRNFMRLGLAGGAVALTGPRLSALSARAWAGAPAADRDRVLVAIFLRGGADALNIVMPRKDPEYLKLRPGIAVVDGDDAAAAPLVLDELFGMNPALAALAPFWAAGSFAPVLCAGSPHPTRSHFDAQDFMEYAAPGRRDIRDGWLNRYLAASASGQKDEGLRAVAMQKKLPRALRGQYAVLAAPARSRKDIDEVLDQFDDLYGDPGMSGDDQMGERPEEDAALDVGRDTIEKLRRFYTLVEDTEVAPSPIAYPKGDPGSGLERIARAIKAKAGLQVAAIDYGGWDTHINQGGATGLMAGRLSNLAKSLAAFATDLGPERMKKVCVVVMTEFGRTCAENGNKGTDHGHGSHMLLLSGALKEKKVQGRWEGLDPKKLYTGRDLPVTTDFRAVFNELLDDFMGFAPPKDFFPDFKAPRRLGLFA